MGTRSRLSLMMGLAYAVQGAWWPLLAVHLDSLGVSERGRGLLFATLAMSAIIAPPIAGRIADRSIPAQKLLAILFAAGAIVLAALAVGVWRTLGSLFPVFVIYWIVLIPYLNLTSAIALRNLARPREEFGGVRLWGTVGWMAAGWLVSGVMLAGGFGTRVSFAIAACLAAVMAIVSLTLPNTPPLATAAKGIPIREAMALLQRPGVAALLAAGFLVSMTTPYVYQSVPLYMKSAGLNPAKLAWAMSLGQPTEIVALSFLPVVLARLGRRWTMALGASAWVAYHLIFATRPNLVIALITLPLNGLAIAFFHIVAPMALDEQAPPDRRAGVQGLWVMTTSGLGSLFGGLLAGEVMQRAAGNWTVVFAVPATIALAAVGLILVVMRTGPALAHVPKVIADRARALAALESCDPVGGCIAGRLTES